MKLVELIDECRALGASTAQLYPLITEVMPMPDTVVAGVEPSHPFHD